MDEHFQHSHDDDDEENDELVRHITGGSGNAGGNGGGGGGSATSRGQVDIHQHHGQSQQQIQQQQHHHHHHHQHSQTHHSHHSQHPQNFRGHNSIMDQPINLGNSEHHNSNSHSDQESSFQGEFYANMARSATTLFNQATQDHSASGNADTSRGSDPYSPMISNPTKITPPIERRWPSRDVTDETIDDAYVQFILSCNPTIPLDCDIAELKKAFRMPPKSDGNTFSTFKLLQLISKFEEKEIKTWTKLAVELGVERKDDQSTQKVQQYAVRLKRWMHAMHIDAFFEYCLNKPHIYYTNIPQTPPTSPDYVRDGVPLEEDLALRALHPETRPKRGRRKTEDKTEEGLLEDDHQRVAKRAQLDMTSPPTDMSDQFNAHHSLFQQTPQSAITGGVDQELERYLDPVTPDQWTTTAVALSSSINSNGSGSLAAPPPSAGGGQQFRWRAFPRESPGQQMRANVIQGDRDDTMTPITPSISTPTSATKPRARRRHGPAVSSAWPSSGGSMTGKLRGRPPTNRSVRDGPFSTFPVNPNGKQGPSIDLTPMHYPSASASASTTVTSASASYGFVTGRPQGLHVQVPSRNNSTTMVNLAANIETQHINGNGLSGRSVDKDLPFVTDKSHMHTTDPSQFELQEHEAQLTVDYVEHQFVANILFNSSDDPNMTTDKAKAIACAVTAELRKNNTMADDESILTRNAAVLMGSDGMHIADLYVTRVDEALPDAEHDTQLSHSASAVVNHQRQKVPGNNGDMDERAGDDLGDMMDDGDEDDDDTHDILNDRNNSNNTTHSNRSTIQGDEMDTGQPTAEMYNVEWSMNIGMMTVNCATRVTINTLQDTPTLTLQDVFGGMEGAENLGTGGAGTTNMSIDDDTGTDIDMAWKEKYFQTQELLKRTRNDMEKLKKGILESVMAIDLIR